MVNKKAQVKLDCINLELLSDLGKIETLAVLKAMSYSDIRRLPYKQVIKLWAPLQVLRKGWRGSATYSTAAQAPCINALQNRVEELEDAWAKQHRIRSYRPAESQYSSIYDDETWTDARCEECISGTRSPDFMYSEDDTDLWYIG